MQEEEDGIQELAGDVLGLGFVDDDGVKHILHDWGAQELVSIVMSSAWYIGGFFANEDHSIEGATMEKLSDREKMGLLEVGLTVDCRN